MIRPHIEIDESRCKGCELCVSVCPRQLIVMSSRINRLGYRLAQFQQPVDTEGKWTGCTGCTVCGLVCPDTAIEVYR